MKHIFIYL